jgi:uncharacterized protein (DUF39 family)
MRAFLFIPGGTVKMTVKKSYEEINEKIRKGNAVVVTAEELFDIVDEKGISDAAKYVDVVTTATFGPMCSTGAFLNFGHSDPPIKMEKIELDNVSAYGGLASVDTYIGATEPSKDRDIEYGGAHVICNLIDGKKIHLKAYSRGTDCYPRKELDTYITKDTINEAYLYNPRNCYQNYSAAANTSDRTLYTYMGVLQPFLGNVNYSTAGELSPLLKDPYLRTIGIGTRIFLAGAEGYVAWQGTQFASGKPRGENGVPLSNACTLAVIGNLKEMSTEFIQPAVFEKYGISMFVGIGIPIPVLDTDLLLNLSVRNKDIYTNIVDYSVQSSNKPVLTQCSYEELRSGFVSIEGKKVKTSPLTSLYKSREIAQVLKSWVAEKGFTLQAPIASFPEGAVLKSLQEVQYEQA